MKLEDFRRHGKVTPTRYNDGGVALYIHKTGPVWRVLVDHDGDCCASGDHAATKEEAFLCVLPNVARNWGFTS
jgi:hypothetical protein